MATEQQQQKKQSQKRGKTLREVIPHLGFEYRVGQNIFENPKDSYALKTALHQVANNLNKTEVDELFADLMKKAKKRPRNPMKATTPSHSRRQADRHLGLLT